MKSLHFGPIFRMQGGHLGVIKMIVTRHVSIESATRRFNWLFEKEYYGHIFIARLLEAQIVDHVIVIDSRLWNTLIYGSSDLCPILLSSSGLFHCAGPGANKVKIVDLYEVLRHQKKYETCYELKQQLLVLPRRSAPTVVFACHNILLII